MSVPKYNYNKSYPTVRLNMLDPNADETAISALPCLVTKILAIKSGENNKTANKVNPIT